MISIKIVFFESDKKRNYLLRKTCQLYNAKGSSAPLCDNGLFQVSSRHINPKSITIIDIKMMISYVTARKHERPTLKYIIFFDLPDI